MKHELVLRAQRPEIEKLSGLLINLCRLPVGENHRLTIYSGVGHNSWTETYDMSAGNDVYTWLLGFTRP